MIFESILIVLLALGLDFAVGDPKSKFHPTAWIGTLIAKLTPFAKNSEKLGGVVLVLIVTIIVSGILIALDFGIKLITIDYISFILSILI